MGFWDEVVKVVPGAPGEGGRPAPPVAPAMSASLVQEAVNLLTGGGSGSGGLAALVQGCERQGLGHVIGSWLGPGENLPISGPQLQAVLGDQRLAQAAQRLGLPPAAAATTLAAVLPAVVDRLTPNGTLEQQLLRQGLDWIEGRAAPAPSA
ncbi:MAG: DUF937 domain-containing protein [Acidobacteria bacterium]|nr:DUF937 domain-containing protein [Acidobacteriota bacterium]